MLQSFDAYSDTHTEFDEFFFRHCVRAFCYIDDYNSNNTGIKNKYINETKGVK